MELTARENVPLPGELEAEAGLSHLRHQKTLSSRAGRWWARLRWFLSASFLLLFGAGVGYSVATFVLTSPRFVLGSADDVVVDGNHYVSREEVLKALGIPTTGSFRKGINIFRLSLRASERKVELIPWVRSATLIRAYPHRLFVRVVERRPVAFADVAGRVAVVDGDGVVLEKPARASFDFPVLTGLEGATSKAERRFRLGLYQDFEHEVVDEATQSGWSISEVDVSDAENLKVLFVHHNETTQLSFGHDNFGERFHKFLALLPELHKTVPRISSADLRYENQVIVNPQSVVPQSAGSTKTEAGNREPNR